MEAVTVLPLVVSFVGGNRSAPQGALEVGGARGIRAIVGVGIQRRVSLNVHVESDTAICLVTEGSASESIITVDSMKAHIVRSAQGGL